MALFRGLGVGLTLLLAFSLPAAAQVRVESLTVDLTDVPISSDVVLVRSGSVTEEPLEAGTELFLKDELRSRDGYTVVSVRCPEGALMTFTGRMRVSIVRPAERQHCAIDVMAGNAISLSDGPTGMESGEETLIAAGATHYELRVSRGPRGPIQEVFVYEGYVDVRLRSTNERARVSETSQGRIRDGRWSPQPLANDVVNETADVYARVAASQAADPEGGREKVRDVLAPLYQAVLREPQGRDPILSLATELVNYRASLDTALYQLERAERLTAESESDKKAAIAVLKGAVYSATGDDEQARKLYLEAETWNRVPLDEGFLRKHGIRDDAAVRALRDPRRPSVARQLSVKARTDPKRTKLGIVAQVIVDVYSAEGKPIDGASVGLTVDGGWFDENKSKTVKGTTKLNGTYDAGWRCEPCAASYQFWILVDKKGFESAKQEIALTTALVR